MDSSKVEFIMLLLLACLMTWWNNRVPSSNWLDQPMHPFHRHPEWWSIKRHRRSNVSFWTPCFSGFSKSQSCEQIYVSTKTMNIFYTPPKTKPRCNLTKFQLFCQREGCPFSCSMGAWSLVRACCWVFHPIIPRRKVSRIREDLEVVLRRHKFLS